ncbi:P-II family nitrogen regulator [Candidatus Contubernalis alkaliaceticus]|uniref:P-II family nitrogen regulator n=1 Tax=Candidatus Contubernalis alkaliaceticus TaxID=338645 RepID=UPI001F4BCED3|nr:P-II family nitrogen regulator [Candidatus Contubernalis alkalaceticus]UNC92666.1 P-II family nitrogen regulator [Candidatus Contubernalis alkalaceticus]
MKEVMAVIRMHKVAETKRVLVEAGYNSLTAIRAVGRGKMLKDLSVIDKVGEEARDMILESMLKGGRLIPKRLLNIIVPDEEVKKVVEIIISVNKEGHSGDGKIFVLPVNDAVRVRTSERGEEAI